MAAIAQVERDYSVDRDRISLTGLSTGGYGTFAIGAKYPNVFAALVPMCPSGGDSKDAAVLAKMSIWAVENAADPFVMPGSMAGTLSAIESAGGHPKHTVYGAFGHDCWERAYAEGELFQWLLEQRLPASARRAGGDVPHATLTPSRSAARRGPRRWVGRLRLRTALPLPSRRRFTEGRNAACAGETDRERILPPELLTPSKPRSPRWWRVLGLLALLALAILSVWWIDRGVLKPGDHPTPRHGT